MDNLALYHPKKNLRNQNYTTAEDKTILNALEPVADAVANLFGSNCSLDPPLEDLSTSVVKICTAK